MDAGPGGGPLVLLVGWILFLVLSARRARQGTASRAAVNLTTSTPTDLGGLAAPSDRIAVNIKTLRLACRSREMSVSTAKLEQRTQDLFCRTGRPASSFHREVRTRCRPFPIPPAPPRR
jgi:hypothetical protein